MKKCYISYNNNDYITVKSEYDSGFVDDIKSIIPRDFRKWDKDNRVWLVHVSELNALIDILKTYYDVTINISNKKFKSLLNDIVKLNEYYNDADDDYSVLYLLPNAPEEVVKASYRALIKKYHPDVNDSGSDISKKINIAYNRIKRGIK